MSDENIKEMTPIVGNVVAEQPTTVTTDDGAEPVIIGEPEPTDEELVASKADVQECTEAIRELTKVVGENMKENVKWFRAGKMGGA